MNAITTLCRPGIAEGSTAADTGLLHIHFGAGRLGLGLIAPFFQRPGSRLFLMNRAVSGDKATGSTALPAERRNQLLRDNPEGYYVVQKPGGSDADRHPVHYDGFFEYDEDNLEGIIQSIVSRPFGRPTAVMVTASLLSAENYGPVIKALNIIARMAREREHLSGRIFLVACENTLSAREVCEDEALSSLLLSEARESVTCVHALVDRMCVGLEEDRTGPRPVVLVRAEDYGSVKLELTPDTEDLEDLCRGSRVEFSRHVDTEKQIKSWLLNGTHWLIALDAFDRTDGDKNLKLNQFILSSPENERFARGVMQEMRDGVAALLRSDPTYAGFVRDVDVDQYLDGAAEAILQRFVATDDPMVRILARFQAPRPNLCNTIESFTKRLADRVDAPMRAFEAEKGTVPKAASHSIQSLVRLLASGKFIDLQ
jgi:mannitol-1-phosphate/altronate dehydrogenase